MEAALPNLLIRTVTDPIETLRQASPGIDHHPHSGVSFRSKSPVAGAGSPLSLSPRSLHLEVKDRRDPASPALPNGRVRSGDLLAWAEAADSVSDDEIERSRVLSLGIWTDEAIGGDSTGNDGALIGEDVLRRFDGASLATAAGVTN